MRTLVEGGRELTLKEFLKRVEGVEKRRKGVRFNMHGGSVEGECRLTLCGLSRQLADVSRTLRDHTKVPSSFYPQQNHPHLLLSSLLNPLKSHPSKRVTHISIQHRNTATVSGPVTSLIGQLSKLPVDVSSLSVELDYE